MICKELRYWCKGVPQIEGIDVPPQLSAAVGARYGGARVQLAACSQDHFKVTR
jgi:hypothetical protein